MFPRRPRHASDGATADEDVRAFRLAYRGSFPLAGYRLTACRRFAAQGCLPHLVGVGGLLDRRRPHVDAIQNGTGFWSLSIAPNGSEVVGGNNDGAFASNDGGVTWRALPTGGPVTQSVAIAPSQPRTIYRLTNTAAGGLLSGLFRSDDGGADMDGPALARRARFRAPIAVDPRHPRSIWIGLAHSTAFVACSQPGCCGLARRISAPSSGTVQVSHVCVALAKRHIVRLSAA